VLFATCKDLLNFNF